MLASKYSYLLICLFFVPNTPVEYKKILMGNVDSQLVLYVKKLFCDHKDIVTHFPNVKVLKMPSSYMQTVERSRTAGAIVFSGAK